MGEVGNVLPELDTLGSGLDPSLGVVLHVVGEDELRAVHEVGRLGDGSSAGDDLVVVDQVHVTGGTGRAGDGTESETETLVDDGAEVGQVLELLESVLVVLGVGEVAEFLAELLEDVGVGDEVVHDDAESSGGGLSTGEENDGTLVEETADGTLVVRDGRVTESTNKDGRLGVGGVAVHELANTLLGNFVSHDQEISDGGDDHTNAGVGELLEDGDEEREEAGKMVDLGETEETVTDDKVEVRDGEVIFVDTVETRRDNIGSKSAEDTVERERLLRLNVLLDTLASLGDTLVDGRLERGDGTLGEVRVEITTAGTVSLVVDGTGGGSGHIKGTDGIGILVGLSVTGGVDVLVVVGVADVNLTVGDTDNVAVLLVHLLNLPEVLTITENLMVELVPGADDGDVRSRDVAQGMEPDTVDAETENVDGVRGGQRDEQGSLVDLVDEILEHNHCDVFSFFFLTLFFC